MTHCVEKSIQEMTAEIAAASAEEREDLKNQLDELNTELREREAEIVFPLSGRIRASHVIEP